MIAWKQCAFSYDDLLIMDDFSFSLSESGTTVFLGPSGCGKTTMLNLAAGLLKVHSGRVINSDENLSYLFQKPRLLPWKSVLENICFALPQGMSKGEKLSKCQSLIRMVGLEGFEDYQPSKLSGGMEQRTSIARAFVTERPLLLMDEPFKGLDLKLKMPLIDLLKELIQTRNTTAVLVTHDVREAILMGDRIVFLDGPPLEVIEDIEGLFPLDERNTASKKFYDMEKRLYSLIFK
ncbi:ABC transporter ATP-binding protein [Oceanispirochaeta crateris]|uniref:ABC transporter ATP-binding protein n=1 Tax=Oceanispirochaeta crateris TaxID=2518645 RepID=A0A5C1QMR9_9SPIO|nr:ABC transporter ATP-binding protein [Oceanispirochaeta crateris]QEN07856.1 ABC transporter ATP-binding protein [Oceanispirochaeta crateris]